MEQRADIRPFAEGDSLQEMTALLHRAYADLARRGMNFVATDQDVETTASRVHSGSCFVATRDGALVGTITVYPPDRTESCELYARDGVWHFGQYGVEPTLQGCGIGRLLLDAAEQLARSKGALEMALDTAEPATDLIALYSRWGFETVGYVQWHGRNYRSVLMSKPLSP